MTAPVPLVSHASSKSATWSLLIFLYERASECSGFLLPSLLIECPVLLTHTQPALLFTITCYRRVMALRFDSFAKIERQD